MLHRSNEYFQGHKTFTYTNKEEKMPFIFFKKIHSSVKLIRYLWTVKYWTAYQFISNVGFIIVILFAALFN